MKSLSFSLILVESLDNFHGFSYTQRRHIFPPWEKSVEIFVFVQFMVGIHVPGFTLRCASPHCAVVEEEEGKEEEWTHAKNPMTNSYLPMDFT